MKCRIWCLVCWPKLYPLLFALFSFASYRMKCRFGVMYADQDNVFSLYLIALRRIKVTNLESCMPTKTMSSLFISLPFTEWSDEFGVLYADEDVVSVFDPELGGFDRTFAFDPETRRLEEIRHSHSRSESTLKSGFYTFYQSVCLFSAVFFFYVFLSCWRGTLESFL